MKKELMELYAQLDFIMKTARRGLITLEECNRKMINAIESAYTLEYFDTKMKAYHRMYKLLFDLTKGN